MSTSVRNNVIRSLKNKNYRDSYVKASIRNGVALQIRAMREDRKWTQSELGARAGMKQERISTLEDLDYGAVNLNTLQRLASAFDVAVMVRFVPFSRLVDSLVDLKEADLAVPGFDDDALLEDRATTLDSQRMVVSGAVEHA
ncbi:MAG: helix-turn-helix transcriptional regulator [Chloroflexi bacterium]|nr:helix-turn-helix transcriptional regulator [Chloroflexota bacterium]